MKTRKQYYIENQDILKKYQLEYYHKNKILKKIDYISRNIKYFKNRIINNCSKIYILKEYNKNSYWKYINENRIQWQYINEIKLFNINDRKYIEEMKPY